MTMLAHPPLSVGRAISRDELANFHADLLADYLAEAIRQLKLWDAKFGPSEDTRGLLAMIDPGGWAVSKAASSTRPA